MRTFTYGQTRPDEVDEGPGFPPILGNPAEVIYSYLRDLQARKWERRTYITYVLYDREDDQYYVGRASAAGVLAGEQVFNSRYSSVFLRAAGYEMDHIDTRRVGDDTRDSWQYAAMRGREQQLYDNMRINHSMGNIRNPIWPWNPRCKNYQHASTQEFGFLSPSNCSL